MLSKTLCEQKLQLNASQPSRHVASSRAISRHMQCKASSAGGFGKSNKKKLTYVGGLTMPEKVKGSKLDDGTPANRAKSAAEGAPPGFPENWIDLKFKASDIPIGKNTKPVELAAGRTLIVYKFEGMVYVSDANSTAYQYPMVDAKVFRDSSGSVAAEVPLDGTVYDLATGAVLKWCPKDSPVRNLLGTLKSSATPTPLMVYPVHVTKDGAIWTKLL